MFKLSALVKEAVPATDKLPVTVASPDTVNVAKDVVPVAVNPANVPTLVKDEAKTFEANVAPDNVPAGATTAAVVILVVKPLALMVITGIAVLPPVVPADATVANADTPADVIVTSPDTVLNIELEKNGNNDPELTVKVLATLPS